MAKTQIDKATFNQLFQEQYPQLCSFALPYIREPEMAEEIVQEVYVKFWMHRKKISRANSLKAYLYTMVKNECLNFLNKKKTEQKYRLENEYFRNWEEQNKETEDLQPELSKKLKQAIARLPEKRREIFIMSKYNGLKYKEIAEYLNISIKTVENQMGDAMQFLRKEMQDVIITIFLFVSLFL